MDNGEWSTDRGSGDPRVQGRELLPSNISSFTYQCNSATLVELPINATLVQCYLTTLVVIHSNTTSISIT